MSDIHFKRHRVFRETDDVIFYDISVEESNASDLCLLYTSPSPRDVEESNAADLVVHTGPAVSPPPDCVGGKQFYIHSFQDDCNRVVQGERTFELVNRDSVSYTHLRAHET